MQHWNELLLMRGNYCRAAPLSYRLGKDDVFGKDNRSISED
jgi:hypothetical protein